MKITSRNLIYKHKSPSQQAKASTRSSFYRCNLFFGDKKRKLDILIKTQKRMAGKYWREAATLLLVSKSSISNNYVSKSSFNLLMLKRSGKSKFMPNGE